MDSILNSVKKKLGITAEYTHFDDDIIDHINSVFMILTQMGVGPQDGYVIEDENNTWSEFTNDKVELIGVKTYMYAKVRMIFDTPLSSSVVQALKDTIDEFEFRLHVTSDK